MELDFYCLCSLQKSILKLIFAGWKSISPTWFLQLDFWKIKYRPTGGKPCGNTVYTIAGDPLKRSINNQLVTQLSFAMILHNIVCTSILTWRILFGPVHHFPAIFESYIYNFWVNWSLLILTETFLIKAFLIFKWTRIVEENFIGLFLILLNLGCIILCQSARWVDKCYSLCT